MASAMTAYIVSESGIPNPKMWWAQRPGCSASLQCHGPWRLLRSDAEESSIFVLDRRHVHSVWDCQPWLPRLGSAVLGSAAVAF